MSQANDEPATGAFHLTIHMVSSVDGFIAKKDNSVDWFEASSHYEKGEKGEDPEAFLKTIDCYLMGARTYEHALALAPSYGWAYGNTPTIVVTSRQLPLYHQHIELYSGDLRRLLTDRLQPHYRKVWLAGGPMLANAFIKLGLANELRLTILPILLGDGIPFFSRFSEKKLRLQNTSAYQNGMVELTYAL